MARSLARARMFGTVLVAATLTLGSQAAPISADPVPGISGRAFEDANANMVADPGEAPFSGHQLYLFDAAGAYRAQAWTAADGTFSISGVADGTYTLEYASPTWSQLRHEWAPTTTGTLRPSRAVVLNGSATVDFGWRQMTWSTDLSAPVSAHTGPDGLRTESYIDAVPATAVHAAVVEGSLIGPEAQHTVVRVGYGSITQAPTSIGGSNGVYSSFASIVYISWNAWLDDAGPSLFHEYGHSWSLYNAYLVQQDGSFGAYLQARGLQGDARVGTSYKWSPGEMIAEDYRQLFGPPPAQERAQANTDIPPASAVLGLRTFLSDTFTRPPAPTPPPPPPVTPVISDLRMSPADVTKSGTVSFSLSTTASVTVAILDSAGSPVRTLLAGNGQPAGSASILWDRTNDSGRRVRAGSYRVRVEASSAGGATSATASFTVR